jgi:hypothetical protein
MRNGSAPNGTVQPHLQTQVVCRQFEGRSVAQEAEGIEKGEFVGVSRATHQKCKGGGSGSTQRTLDRRQRSETNQREAEVIACLGLFGFFGSDFEEHCTLAQNTPKAES